MQDNGLQSGNWRLGSSFRSQKWEWLLHKSWQIVWWDRCLESYLHVYPNGLLRHKTASQNKITKEFLEWKEGERSSTSSLFRWIEKLKSPMTVTTKLIRHAFICRVNKLCCICNNPIGERQKRKAILRESVLRRNRHWISPFYRSIKWKVPFLPLCLSSLP